MSGGRFIERMPLSQRIQHWALIATFALLVLTGLPMMLDPSPMMKAVLSRGEVFWWRGVVHRGAAIGLIALCFAHLLYLLFSERGHRDFKSLMPGFKDARDATGALAVETGFVRLLRRTPRGRLLRRRLDRFIPEKHPRYGRFTFIEKFEYLAVAWGSFLMIVTGLMLWFEEATMALFPRSVFDFVRVLHSYEAILAFLAIIIWHMYQVHFRPGAFPMSRIWLDGKISLDELKDEHPLEYEELLALGSLPGEPARGSSAPLPADSKEALRTER